MIYILAVIFSVIFMIMILLLVRNNKMEEKYCILWLVFGIGIIILSMFPKIVDFFARILGVAYAPSLIFVFTFAILSIYIIHLSVVNTKQNKRIIKLTQEMAILNQKIDNNIKE